MLEKWIIGSCVVMPCVALADTVTVTITVGDPAKQPAAVLVESEEPPAPVVAPPEPQRFAARVTLGRGRDDGGTFSHPITGALSYAVAGSARIVASGSLMAASSPERDSTFVPLRLGLEGRAGAAGLELGGFVSLHRDCSGEPRAGGGGYTSGRVYVPMTERHDFVIEVTAHYAVLQPYCSRPTMETVPGEGYGAYVGAGIEWRL